VSISFVPAEVSLASGESADVVLLLQNTSSSIHYAGSWATSSSSAYSGGSVKTSSTAGASATYSFTGRGIALVSTLSASRGTVRVYVDGVYQGRIDPSHAPTVFHGVAWQMIGFVPGRPEDTLRWLLQHFA